MTMTTTTYLGNIRGPRGYSVENATIGGDGHLRLGLTDTTVLDAGMARGLQGLPGLENVPTDPGVAALISTPSETQAAGDARYGRRAHRTINVKDYGAAGDGLSDDRPAIQAALDAAGVGGTTYFPSGIYLLATKPATGDRILVLSANQTLIGDNRNSTTLRIGASFGDYKTVLGMSTDAGDAGRFAMSGIRVDQNAANGNALNTGASATYPRNVLRIITYTAESVVSITDCAFDNASNVNSFYIAANYLDVSNNLFLGTGIPTEKTWHDHSTVYLTVSVEGGTQTITGNTFRGNLGSGGATTAIETHGGSQVVAGNAISGYQIGANLTGYTNIVRARKVVCNSNTIDGALVGIQVWSYYVGSVTTGTALENVIISGNAITLDRDAWLGITGLLARASGIITSEGGTAPMDGLTVSGNVIQFKPSVGTPPSGDSGSYGIKVSTVATAAEMRNVKILDNTIINPLSTGIFFAGVIRQLTVRGNTVQDPAQSTHSSVVAVYRSFAVIGAANLNDATFESNVLVDTRATHYSAYMIIALSSLIAAVNVISRNNSIRFIDGATAPAPFTPSSVANTAPFMQEAVQVWSPIFQNTKAGSTVREMSTGKLYTQTVAPSGATWVATGP